jgi:D-glucuronyl C5-epimerase C-terminus
MNLKASLSLLLFAFTNSALMAGDCDIGSLPTDSWPAIPVFTETSDIAQDIVQYQQEGWDWRPFTLSGPYQWGGDYLNWAGSAWSPIQWNTTTSDGTGTIMQSYDDGLTFVYQPATIAQYALWLYSDSLHGNALSPLFRTNVEYLLSTQLTNGAVPANFALPDFWPPLPNGWVSGLTQGQAISAWTRAYKVFGDPRYLEGARKAAAFMLTPTADGGCLDSLSGLDPSLARYDIVQEYPGHPDYYTLNDACFAVLGLYDWSEYDPSVNCTITRLVETIGLLLPYYDMGGFTTENLQHVGTELTPEVQPVWHMLNTMLVWALDSLFPSPQLNKAWGAWSGYVGQPLDNLLKVTITPARNSIVVSWWVPGVRLQISTNLTTGWQDVNFEVVNQSVTVPTSNGNLFFRLLK